jgi:hypothetical protein
MAFDSRLLAGVGVLAVVLESGNFARAVTQRLFRRPRGSCEANVRGAGFLPDTPGLLFRLGWHRRQ